MSHPTNPPTHMDSFIKEAIRTESIDLSAILSRIATRRDVRLLHAAMGSVTEAAELIDALKKYIFYGKPLDLTNIKEETGDMLWYQAIIMDEAGWSFEQVADLVIAKLRARYPDKFSSENAVHRDLANERHILEAGAELHNKESLEHAAEVSDYFRTIPVADRDKVISDAHGNTAAEHSKLFHKQNPQISGHADQSHPLEILDYSI